MQVKANLNNLRMSPRKVRTVANLIKGVDIKRARAQLQFTTRHAAAPLLKLLNSAVSNAKHNFNLDENNLYVAKLIVDGGPSLKRWMPRAMGRATPILKRTSHISLVLDEKIPSKIPPKARPKAQKPLAEEPVVKPPAEKEEKIFVAVEPEKSKTKTLAPRPYGASSQAKKKFFSRQTFGNIRKMFQRKSI